MINKRIKPQFSYEDQANLPYNLLDEHMPPMEEQVAEIDPMSAAMEASRKPSSMVDPQSAGLISDAVAAGLPALSAALAGSAPSIQNRQFQRMDQYAKARGNNLVPSKSNLMELADDQGQPYYELAENSLGETPYKQPKSIGSGANGSVGKLIPGKHKINGIPRPTLTNNVTGEVRDQLTGEVYTEGDIYLQPQYRASRSLGGGYNLTKIDPLTGKMQETQLDPGVGEALGGISREEAQQAIRDAAKGKAATQKATEAIAGAERSLAILDKPNLTPEEASSGIFSIIKAINGERLSDSDYANLRGEEFKSYLRQVEDWAGGRIAGRISPKAIAAYKLIAKDMIESKKKEAMSIKRNYTPKGSLPKQGQEKVERAGGIVEEAPKIKEDWKSKLKGLK